MLIIKNIIYVYQILNVEKRDFGKRREVDNLPPSSFPTPPLI